MAEEILWVGIGKPATTDPDQRGYVISEEVRSGYRVLGRYATIDEAERDLAIIKARPRYAHLRDKI